MLKETFSSWSSYWSGGKVRFFPRHLQISVVYIFTFNLSSITNWSTMHYTAYWNWESNKIGLSAKKKLFHPWSCGGDFCRFSGKNRHRFMFLRFLVIALGVQRAIWGGNEAIINHASSWLSDIVWELSSFIYPHFIAFLHSFLFRLSPKGEGEAEAIGSKMLKVKSRDSLSSQPNATHRTQTCIYPPVYL